MEGGKGNGERIDERRESVEWDKSLETTFLCDHHLKANDSRKGPDPTVLLCIYRCNDIRATNGQ